MIMPGRNRDVQSQAVDQRNPPKLAAQLHSTRAGLRNQRFSTIDETSARINQTLGQKSPESTAGMNQLDPRELYRAKKQQQYQNQMARGGGSSLPTRDLHQNRTGRQPVAYFMHRKPANTVFGGGRATVRDQRHHLTAVQMSPVQKQASLPPAQQLLSLHYKSSLAENHAINSANNSSGSPPPAKTSLPRERRKQQQPMLLANQVGGGTEGNQKFNQTLMSYHNRKASQFGTGIQALPAVYHPNTAQTSTNFKTTQEELDFAQSNFRRSVAEQRSSAAGSEVKRQVALQGRKEMANLRNLDPLKRHPGLPDSQGEQRISSPDHPSSSFAVSSPMMKPRHAALTLSNFYTPGKGNKLDSPTKPFHQALPKTSAQQQRNLGLLTAVTQQQPRKLSQLYKKSTVDSNETEQKRASKFGKNENKDVPIYADKVESGQITVENKDQQKSTQQNINNNMSSAINVKPLYGISERENGGGTSRITEEKGSSQIPDNTSNNLTGSRINRAQSPTEYENIKTFEGYENPKSTDLVLQTVQTPDLRESGGIQQQNDSYDGQKNSTALTGELKPIMSARAEQKIDMKPIPTAITQKSSRNIVQKRISNRLPLHNSNSFISGKMTSVQRKPVKKLSSFNSDLRDVVDLKQIKGGSRKSSKQGSNKNKERPRSTMQIESSVTEDWNTHMVCRLNDTDVQQADAHNRSVQEQSEIARHVELLVSKETLPQSRNGDENMVNMASHETFVQKMQQVRPHRLEIKTKSRLQDKISVITPPSHDNTPQSQQEDQLYTRFANNAQQAHQRNKITKGALLSTHTLAMSQFDGKEVVQQNMIKQNNQPARTYQQAARQPAHAANTKVNTAKPTQPQLQQQQLESPTMFPDQQRDFSPMIIQTHNLEKRRVPTQSQHHHHQGYTNRRLTLEERTLKKIAQLKENNSIIIDCDALVGDQRQNANKYQGHDSSPHVEQLKTQDDDTRSAITYLSDAKEPNEERQKQKMSPLQDANDNNHHIQIQQTNTVKKTSQPQKQLQTVAAVAGTTQLLTSPFLVNNKAKVIVRRQNSADATNQDTKEVNGKETAIGVGSVVLHLRKNRNQQNGDLVSSRDENEQIAYLPATLNSEAEDLDIASRGTRELGQAELTSTELLNSVGMASPRGINQYISSPSRQERSSKLGTQPQSVVKNGQVLRQKAFTNIVRTGKIQNKLASPRPAANTRIKNKKGPKLANGAVTGGSLNAQQQLLELIGTQKEKVSHSQLPRLRPYEKKVKQQNRSGSYQPPRASFFIPSYGGTYFGLQPNINAENNFGDTLHQTQMHQLIHLQNGQVIIGRIDVAFTPNNQVNINFDQSNNRMCYREGDGAASSFAPMQTTTDFQYSPVTRLGIESPTNDVITPSLLNENTSPSPKFNKYKSEIRDVAGRQGKQLLELPAQFNNQMMNQHHGEISHEVIDTVCGTDKSNTSLVEAPQSTMPNTMNNVATLGGGAAMNQIIKPQSTKIDLNYNSRVVSQAEQYNAEGMENINSRMCLPQRRNMTQKVSAMLQDTNKSGEILLQEEPLMLAPEYVLSQQITTSNRNEIAASSIHPQSYLAFNTLTKSDGPLVGINDDQASYNYLVAADGRHLQTMDERVSENDDSMLGQISPSLTQYKYIPQAQMPAPTALQPLVVNTTRSNEAATFQLSSTYSSGLSPGRKQIIFNKQSPKNNVLVARSTGSQDSDEHSIIQEAKLQQHQQPSVDGRYKQSSSSSPAKDRNNKKDDVFSKIVKDSIPQQRAEEDPIVAKKKMRMNNHQQALNKSMDKEPSPFIQGFQPWDDKPDFCLAVQGQGQRSRKVSKTNLNQSSDSAKKRNQQSSHAKPLATGKILQSQESLDKGASRFKTSTQSINLRQSVNSQSKPTNQPIRMRNPSKQIVIDDKAKKSERKRQERAMQEIVFDDTNTPQFRHRGEVTYDHTLEEAVRKPMKICEDADGEELDGKPPTTGDGEQDQVEYNNNNHHHPHQHQLQSPKGEDRLSPSQKRILKNKKLADKKWKNREVPNVQSLNSSNQDLDISILDDNQYSNYAIQSNPKDLQALKTAELKFKNRDAIDQLESSFQEEDEDDPAKRGNYKYIPRSKVTVGSPNEDKSMQRAVKDAGTAYFGQLRSKEWRGVEPLEGEDTFYISQARMQSYFK